MRFTKIKVGKEAVELAWTFTDANGATLSTQLTHADKPAPELIEALQAFKPWAMGLIDAPESWHDESRVSTLSLNEEKTGKTRGLMVSMVRPIPRASGRPLSLTTPHDAELRKLLLLVDRDIPEDALALWTSTDRDKAQRWAESTIASKAGTPVQLDDLVEPEMVAKYATPSLGADGWKDSKPPKLDEGAVAEIQASIEKA